jgi:prevent-host-death family protein
MKVSSVEAQSRFDQLLDMVQREPVTITRHGRVVAVMLSPQDMQELRDAQASKRKNAVEAFEAWSMRADATALPAAAELTDEDVVRMVKESR